MNLIPRITLKLESNLDSNTLKKKLETHTRPIKILRNVYKTKDKTKVFEGTIFQNKFSLQPIITYRNSFLPTLKGQIVAEGKGSIIHLTIQPHPIVLAFIGSFIGLVLLIASFIWISAFQAGTFSTAHLIPIGIVVFLWAIVSIGFYAEKDNTLQKIRKVLNAKVITA